MQADNPHLLSEALSKLETALLTPVVSGELASWVRTAQQATGDLGVQLSSYLGSTQRNQYRQMAASDPELLSRIQQLASEDQQLLDEYRKFIKRLDELAQMVAKVQKHESRAEELRSEVEKQGTALILRIRKHQVATDTWLSEAVYRDGGTVD